MHRGRAEAAAGHPSTLSIALEPLPNGIYTVAWRTISRVDGHLTAGALTFGVGVEPTDAADSSITGLPEAWPRPALPGVLGRWVFYIGMAGLLGAAWVWGTAVLPVPSWNGVFATAAWTAATVGIVFLVVGQQRDAGVPLATLLSTAVGRALMWRAAPLLGAGALLLLMHRLRPESRRIPLAGVGLFVAAGLLAHALAGHAAALRGIERWIAVSSQWLHMAAVGIWLGGLAALLAVIRRYEGPERLRAVRRYSTTAGLALGLVILTGLIRTVKEVPDTRLILSTLSGRIILVKVALLGGLAMLGGLNRFRNVPRSAASLSGLRRVAAVELVLAVIALGAAGVLASVAPARMMEQAERPTVEAVGSDFGTSVRAMLQVRPGRPGTNAFTVQITDYDTGRAIEAPRVTLRFTPLERRDVAASTLVLQRRAPGVYHGRGSHLALPGRWGVSVTVERWADSVQISMTLVLPDLAGVEPVAGPGGLPIYQASLPDGGMISAYLDPARPGRNQLHLTFFDGSGVEMAIPSPPSVFLLEDGQRGERWAVRRFGKGHFVVDGEAPGGVSRLSIVVPIDGAGPVETHLILRM